MGGWLGISKGRRRRKGAEETDFWSSQRDLPWAEGEEGGRGERKSFLSS